MLTSNIDNTIFLTGFMGAGKSTVGTLLAEHLNCEFVDLDAAIVEHEQRSIAEIFATDGEDYFRDCESRALNEVWKLNPVVVATGGGIVIRPANREQMRHMGKIVYLKASWPVLQSRLHDSTERPLVVQNEGWGRVEKLWRERQAYYNDADLVIDTDDMSPAEVAREITACLAGS